MEFQQQTFSLTLRKSGLNKRMHFNHHAVFLYKIYLQQSLFTPNNFKKLSFPGSM